MLPTPFGAPLRTTKLEVAVRYLLLALALIAIPALDARADSGAGSTAKSNANAGANAGAVSQSSGGQAGAQIVSYGGGTSTIHNTPEAVPGTIYGGTNPCAVGASGAMSIAGLGIGGGAMWNSPGCERRNAAVILFQANMSDVAVALLCQDDGIRTAFKEAGKPCPADRVQVAAYTEPVAATPAAYSPPPVAAAPAPAMTEASSGRTRPAWCDTTTAPRAADHSPDATSYRFYCQ